MSQFAAAGYLVLDQLPQMGRWETAFIVAAGALLLGKAVELFIIHVVMQRIVARTDTDVDDTILDHIHGPLNITIILGGLYVASLPLSLPARLDFYLAASALTVVTLLWAHASLKVGRTLIQVSQRSKRFDHDFGPVFQNLWTIAVIVGTLFTILSVWDVNITPLLASAGIAGVAIGFAAKDTVANFFGGIALYFDDTYKIGDYVVLDSGDEGTVVDIGVRSTTLRTRDDVLVTVPNSVLNNSRIANQSVPQEKKRITIPVGVAYGTDIDRLEEILIDIAEEADAVVERPEPNTLFRGFGDSALNYELRCWVEEPRKDIEAINTLNRQIYKRLDEDGIEIPFPQRDVHVDRTTYGEDDARTDTR